MTEISAGAIFLRFCVPYTEIVQKEIKLPGSQVMIVLDTFKGQNNNDVKAPYSRSIISQKSLYHQILDVLVQ